MVATTRLGSSISRRTLIRSGAAAAAVAMVRSQSSFAHSEASDFSFLTLGDWGRAGSPSQRQIADEMARVAERQDIRFVISTGDNFYPSGVTNTNDPHWKASFEDVYTAPALMCPWYSVLGNHDHRGNVMAQVAYSKLSSRWFMPSRYYSHVEKLSDATVEFFFIDTTPIINGSTNLSGNGQLLWLKQMLHNSTAHWKIVIGHHPVFSGGSKHGTKEALVECLKPLLDRYGVQVYLNGHDHDLQHILIDGVHYLTSGAGSKARPAGKIEGSLFSAGELGFLSATLSSKAMQIDFIDGAGTPLHTAIIWATA